MAILDGLHALITGAASGIGEAIATSFAAEGARVLVVDLDRERAEVVAGRLPNAAAHACDVSDEAQVNTLFRSLDRLDILVNSAGIGLVGSIEETTLDDFRRLQRVNVEGTFLTARAALPLLKQRRGVILNLASVAGLVGIKRRFAYCATKGAVVALTRQLAVEYPREIRANCIAPGTIDSPFVEGYLNRYHSAEKETVRAELEQRQPVGRLGRPTEVASLALYMCAPAAEFMHGSVVTLDGGWTAA